MNKSYLLFLNGVFISRVLWNGDTGTWTPPQGYTIVIESDADANQLAAVAAARAAADAAQAAANRAAAKSLLSDFSTLPRAIRALAQVINTELNKLRTVTGQPTRTMQQAVADWLAAIDGDA